MKSAKAGAPAAPGGATKQAQKAKAMGGETGSNP